MSRVRRRQKSVVPIVMVWAASIAGAAMVWFAVVWLALKFWA